MLFIYLVYAFCFRDYFKQVYVWEFDSEVVSIIDNGIVSIIHRNIQTHTHILLMEY